VRDDVPIDNDALLVTDFVNLKIKLTQSFRVTHRGKMCVYAFIRVDAHTCMSIYIYTMFKKDNKKKENTFFCVWRYASHVSNPEPVLTCARKGHMSTGKSKVAVRGGQQLDRLRGPLRACGPTTRRLACAPARLRPAPEEGYVFL
jgi:hypothetical protein